MKTIKLLGEKGQGKLVIVDNNMFDYLNSFKWYFSTNGYAATSKNVFMHRLVNNTPKGIGTDHINRNRLDNRKRNLRTANQSLNILNSSIKVNNTSGFKGVSFFKWGKRKKRWLAKIKVNYKFIHLGYFLKKEEAAKAYNEFSNKLLSKT